LKWSTPGILGGSIEMPSENEVARLQTKFSSLDQSTKVALADAVDSPMIVGIAALVLANDLGGIPYLSAGEISLLLEEAGVALTETQVARAFARAGGHISRTRINDKPHYRAMTSGRSLVEPVLASGPIQIVRIEAGKPRSARKKLEEMLAPLNGPVSICDPYYGLRTLDALALIPISCQARFLTSRTSEKTASLRGPLADFKREHPHVQLRILSSATAIHDRYILSTDALMLLGHGIKDIGAKESFVVAIAASYADDLLKLTQSSFDKHWATTTTL
jgi:hypothetical protein